jgi:transposase-like protein
MDKPFFKASSDSEAEDKMLDMGILKYKEVCPYCGSTEIYHIRRNHIKCKKCRREWSKYKDSLLENIRIKHLTFLRIIEKIAEGTLLKNISDDLKVSYNTVLKVRNRIKNQIIKEVFKLENVDGNILIGIKIVEDYLKFEVVKNLNFSIIKSNNVYKIGRIYFIEDYEDFDHLIVISEESIEKLEKMYRVPNIDDFKNEIKQFLEDFSDKIKRGKIINSPTILYTIAQSALQYKHEKDYIVELFLNAFQKA